MCKNPTTTIILNGEKARGEAFPLRSRTRQKYLLAQLLFNIFLKILASTNREQKVIIKGIQIGEEKVKLCLFSDPMILYIE